MDGYVRVQCAMPHCSEELHFIIDLCIYILKGDKFFVCLWVADGQPNGWAHKDQTWHRDSC